MPCAEQDRWKVGKIEPLQPGDESPFLGQVEEGQSQLAVETGMFRAPGFAYYPPTSDYLLIRNAAGVIMLREMTGCIAVGQEVPTVRAPVPHSRDGRSVSVLDESYHIGSCTSLHCVHGIETKHCTASDSMLCTSRLLSEHCWAGQ